MHARGLRRLATSAPAARTTSAAWMPPYARLTATLRAVRAVLPPRPLTLAEKIVYAHLRDPAAHRNVPIVRGETYLKLAPDRVAMQDASAQMALLQFMLSGRRDTAVPTTIHCDHLIVAHRGAREDLQAGAVENREVFDFLRQAAETYKIGFWRPGSGIIHQIVLENYAAPGGLMLGTDSHTPNAGGLGMVAIGVGGADAVDGMADIPWELKAPKVTGVHLKGELDGWASPKDVILELVGKLSVQGGTGHMIEYFGEGVGSLSCTGMATICNMGAEMGATTSVFPYTPRMGAYLRATHRANVADAAERVAGELLAADKGAAYDRVVEIDLSKLEPTINGPFTPDLSHPLSAFAARVQERKWPTKLQAALIGSCTNSSYEDMSRAASIAQQAVAKGLRVKANLLVTPGSEQIRATIERDGQHGALAAAGAQVLANACGPCIGQWKREDVKNGEENAIFSSFNRNFKARNDGNAKTLNFLASPELVTAMAFAGRTDFDPRKDAIPLPDGTAFRFQSPHGAELPSRGFEQGVDTFIAPDPSAPFRDQVVIDPASDRLQRLQPFAPWSGAEFKNAFVLIKVQGKCTTDHISAAGPWLKYKGHLHNLAFNTLIGAVNAENQQVNSALNRLTGKHDTIPAVAMAYQQAEQPWVIVADDNYGEGSAREHAAMQPRYLGCVAVVARSFARIHETNLKKQGVLPLTFVNRSDYDLLTADCTVETDGLVAQAARSAGAGEPLHLVVRSPQLASPARVPVVHTMSADQWDWFRHGSALNMIAASQ